MQDSGETIKKRYLSNVKIAGGETRTTLIVGPSQVELRKLPLGAYDLIYIDGSHFPADVLEDAVLSWRLLKPGGMLIFDDTA
jgi:predicted O-methyltransferase YrrM